MSWSNLDPDPCVLVESSPDPGVLVESGSESKCPGRMWIRVSWSNLGPDRGVLVESGSGYFGRNQILILKKIRFQGFPGVGCQGFFFPAKSKSIQSEDLDPRY